MKQDKLNINFTFCKKEPEIKVKEIVGVFLEFSGISMLGKLLIVSEEREASSDHVARHEGIQGLFLQHGNLVQNIEFWLDVSFRQPKCNQLGHERFIFIAQRGQGGR